MKIPAVGILIASAFAATGCVTEGAITQEPASDAEQVEANLALGIGYLQEERPDLAIDSLQRAIDIQPRNADAHRTIAIAYTQTGELDLAEEHHRRATQLAPRDADTQNGYAVFLCLQNRWDDAEPYFERAIGVLRGAATLTPVMNAATCALGGGDVEASEAYLRRALDVDASNGTALRGMIDLSIRTSNYLQGRAFWQRLERSGQLQAEDYLSCYVIETQLNSNQGAAGCADRLAREFPGSPALSQLRDIERDGG
ncbi:MAG: tetratricopeptide repeat protein [Gammaproteobacteria bacterium]|jgi:type IV pilus assembly protein PilF